MKSHHGIQFFCVLPHRLCFSPEGHAALSLALPISFSQQNKIILDPLTFSEARFRPSLEERLESIISGAALMADSSCTRDDRRERIVAECNAVRQALQDLLSEYMNNVSFFSNEIYIDPLTLKVAHMYFCAPTPTHLSPLNFNSDPTTLPFFSVLLPVHLMIRLFVCMFFILFNYCQSTIVSLIINSLPIKYQVLHKKKKIFISLPQLHPNKLMFPFEILTLNNLY